LTAKCIKQLSPPAYATSTTLKIAAIEAAIAGAAGAGEGGWEKRDMVLVVVLGRVGWGSVFYFLFIFIPSLFFLFILSFLLFFSVCFG